MIYILGVVPTQDASGKWKFSLALVVRGVAARLVSGWETRIDGPNLP